MPKISLVLLALLLPLTPRAGDAPVWREPVTGIEFIRVEKGCFRMGLPANAFADDHSDLHRRAKAEMPAHEACLDAYWLARQEVTEAQWQAVMGGERRPPPAPDRPAVNLSWEDAQAFVRRLNDLAAPPPGPARRVRYRLPTEAEWEHACRAGAPPQATLADARLGGRAWFSTGFGTSSTGKRLGEVQPVGILSPNAWGFHDMLGNAWEWVEDAYLADAYRKHALYNPVQRADDNEKRVIRGGSIRTSGWMTRCETRAWMVAGERMDTVGLRVAAEDER